MQTNLPELGGVVILENKNNFYILQNAYITDALRLQSGTHILNCWKVIQMYKIKYK